MIASEMIYTKKRQNRQKYRENKQLYHLMYTFKIITCSNLQPNKITNKMNKFDLKFDKVQFY
jgi:hypothetical protein